MSSSSEAITVRGLDPGTKQKLRMRAAARGHSMEEEVRSILRTAIAKPDDDRPQHEEVDLGTAIRRRFAKYGGVDLELPPRGPDREPPDFSE